MEGAMLENNRSEAREEVGEPVRSDNRERMS